MTWLDTLRTGGDAIRHHRLRSALTMLGILIGIAAVMLTVGIGRGAQDEVDREIDALGTDLLIVSPGSSTDQSTGVQGGFGSAATLTAEDAEALASDVAAPDVAAVAPTASSSQALTAGEASWTTNLVGTTDTWLEVRNREVETGRFLTAEDVEEGAAVAVLAPDTATELFGTAARAVGRSVVVGEVEVEVVGVLAPSGSSADSNEDDQALVPLTTAQESLTGRSAGTGLTTVYVQAADPDSSSAAYQEVDGILRARHGVDDDDVDFTITTPQSLLDTSDQVGETLTVLLGGVAAVALVVGGIGVMNIMLVSVTERVREIGLRKSLGADPGMIRRQFLVEASLLGLAGGVLGVVVGIAVGMALPRLTDLPVSLSAPAAAVAIATATGIALLVGVYPASRAARLAPIDALRSE